MSEVPVKPRPQAEPQTDTEGCNPRSLIAVTLALVLILLAIGCWLVNR